MKGRANVLPRARAWRAAAWLAVPPLVAIHLIFAPLSFLGTYNSVRWFGGLVERAALSLPTDAALANQRLIVVNTPSSYVSTVGLVLPRLDGRPMPQRMLVVGAGIYPTHVSRPTRQSIAVHPEGGFLADSGSPRPGHEREQPVFDMRYMLQMFDRLYRDTPVRQGNTIRLSGVAIEMTRVTPDGRPDVVTYTFDRDVEDASLRWVQWHDGVYVPFRPPEVGQTVTLSAVGIGS